MGFWEIFDTQFQHFARLNLQVLNILTDRQNDGMVSAVFYKIYPTLDLGLCIYIKWLFNQIPLTLENTKYSHRRRQRNIVSEGLANLVNLSDADVIMSQTQNTFSLAPAPAPSSLAESGH